MKKIIVASLMLSFLNVGAVLAQTSSEKAPPVQVRYQQTTRYDFDNEKVEGTTLQPNGEMVGGIKKGRPSSLVKSRQHFTPEMLKSVEGL